MPVATATAAEVRAEDVVAAQARADAREAARAASPEEDELAVAEPAVPTVDAVLDAGPTVVPDPGPDVDAAPAAGADGSPAGSSTDAGPQPDADPVVDDTSLRDDDRTERAVAERAVPETAVPKGAAVKGAVVKAPGVKSAATKRAVPKGAAVRGAAAKGAAATAARAAATPADTPPTGSTASGAPAPKRRRGGQNLREVRRQQTRETIVDAASALFVERGFDHVSVLEIAQRAGVVEKTVFNHFPVKEGLVFEADPPMQAALLDAVRRRRAGESVAAAAGTFIVAACSRLGDPRAAGTVAEMARVIRGSRTLQVREREILGQLTDALAEQITLETRAEPGELEPWLTANAVLGLYQALLELARDRVLGPDGTDDLVEELRARGERGLALLQFGLAGYVKRRA
ncbi:TetR/AcrR family transcriptional regulator [Modestobacter sp. Leaf380]|uniref:TetR/AcrR family transcriptional regulator n=1 Tax=Modestobacter sp. Leaf380 TaxID=1736356 RepID=UPI001F380E65|nr:TetR/AcrR family transcriptional regulator [Modestobacter sp. Leaf380]